MLGLLGGALLGVAPGAWGQAAGPEDWDVVTRAVAADPTVRQAVRVSAQADDTLEAAGRTWWPRLSLEAPALVSVSGTDRPSGFTSVAGATVTQKLPGKGSLTAGVSQTVTKSLEEKLTEGSPTFVPEVTLGLTQPLGLGLVGPEGDKGHALAVAKRLEADIRGRIVVRDAFRTVLARMAALDQARATVVWRRALVAAAEAEAELVAAWFAQGRATPSETWKADRDREAARWALGQALRTVESLERAWERSAGFSLPEGASPRVVALRRFVDALPQAHRDLEDDLAEVLVHQARDSRDLELSGTYPQLRLTATARKPDHESWAFEAQAGVTLSTDGWITAPVDRTRLDQEVLRLDEIAADGLSERTAQRQEREHELSLTDEYMGVLEAHLVLQGQRVAQTQILTAQGQITQADLATAQADLAALEVELCKARWDALALRAQNVVLS